MPFSRTLIAIACTAGLIALPAAATGAKKPKTAQSHVIKTAKGNQLAVPITVRYTLKGKSLDRSRLTTRTAIAARLPGGRVVRAVEKRTIPGKARVKVEHHPFFGVRHTRVLRKALNAGQTVKLTVANSLTADVDGDGDTDARTNETSSQVLAKPSRPRAGSPANALRGDDPCGVLNLAEAVCRNVAAPVWQASHLWARKTSTITCPAAFPVATETARYRTTSQRFTPAVMSDGTRAQVTLIDDNVRGHPLAYTATVACTATRG